MAELLNCPFCGGPAKWADRACNIARVKCADCGATVYGPESRNYDDASASALAVWNTRAPSPELLTLRAERDEARAIVSVKEMKLSPRPDGTTSEFYVSIRVGDRDVTPHVFRERFKAEYHVALYDWLLNGTGDEPEVMAFGG